jgi:thiol-disulfide isomerase/thioredoxin/tetratricopeptide (TPR) repeat protein
MLPWLLAALLPIAQAAEPTALDRAWYLAESSRIEEALSATALILQEHPEDVGAHRLYAWLWIRGLRDAPGAEALYREWLVQDPDNDAARIVLANQLRWASHHPGAWCTEAESLLVQPPAALEDVYWAQRALHEIRRVCPGDQDAPRLAIMKLGEQLPEARAYGLRLQLEDLRITTAQAQDLAAFMAEQPWRLTYAGNPWMMHGEGAEAAQQAALAQAGLGLTSEDPLLVEAARRLFRYADDQERLLEAEERLRTLDPGFVPNQFRFEGGVQWVARPEDQPGEPGSTRRPTARGQSPRKALAAAREAWEAQPDDPHLANDFAYQAATAGLELELALEAIRGAVDALPAYDPRGDHPARGYDDWLQHSADHAAAFADTHGWVLHRLGRDEEAAAKLRQALLLAAHPSAVHHLHLGLVYDALGDEQAALRQLGRGLALADGQERDLERQAYRRMVELYQRHRWAPGGLETWIALQGPQGGAAEPGAEDEPEARGVARVGQPFADIAFVQGDQQRRLSEIEGVRVVDLWATWCGPCVEAMPSMEKLAKRFADRGVTFVAISVDGDPADVEAFFGGEVPRHIVMGWAGRSALREARVTGIPSMFVLDAQGVVRAYHSGWGMGRVGDRTSSERIEASIEEVLEAGPEGGKE